MIKSLKINTLVVIFTIISSVLAISCKNESKPQNLEEKPTTHRIVSLQGAVTEVIAALGYEDQLVGVDVTSTYPETVKNSAKDLGHVRSITIEPILELQPTVILASDKDINPGLMEKIQQSGIQTHLFTQEYSIDGTKNLIKQVATVLGATDYEVLLQQIDTDYSEVTAIEQKPKVLFIYARGAGTLMVAGNNTPMRSIVELAGGAYAVTSFDDFKPLTPESLIESNPDVILLFDSGLQSLGGAEGLLQVPGVVETNAGKNKKIISMEGGFLSGFGPRVGKAATQLNAMLRAE